MLVAQLLLHVNKNKFKVWLTLSTVGGEILTSTKDNKILNPSRILDLKKLYKSVLYFYLHYIKLNCNLLCAIFPGTLYMDIHCTCLRH